MTQENENSKSQSTTLTAERERDLIDEISKLVAEETLQETEEPKGD